MHKTLHLKYRLLQDKKQQGLGAVLNYLPSGLLGEVRNMHFGFSCCTAIAIFSTSKLKSGLRGTVKFNEDKWSCNHKNVNKYEVTWENITSMVWNQES